MRIEGATARSAEQVAAELTQGARFVAYQYCISVLILTFRRSSSIVYIPPGGRAVSKGMPFTVVSLLLGWWGIPWGPIYTIGSVYRNLRGGIDVTEILTTEAGSDGIEIVPRGAIQT
jgi:hypothetical protein